MDHSLNNHKPNTLPKSVLQDISTPLHQICSTNGFNLTRYASSLVAIHVSGNKTAEFKVHFPTKSESILAIDHTVTQKSQTGRRVKSTRSLVSPKDVEVVFGALIKEPWSLTRTSAKGSDSNASSEP